MHLPDTISYPEIHSLQIWLPSFNSQLTQFLSEHINSHLFSINLYLLLHSIHTPKLSLHLIQFLSHDNTFEIFNGFETIILSAYSSSNNNSG